MENENCLMGMKCPKCGEADTLFIDSMCMFKITDDGSEPVGGVEWTDDSTCRCGGCDHVATVAAFTVPE